MKTKILSSICLSLAFLIILTSFISASMTLTDISAPSTVSRNSEITVNFKLSADTDYTSLNWQDSSSSKATWKTLPSLTSITAGSTQTLSAVLKINEYASGTINDAIILVKDTTTSNTDLIALPLMTITPSAALSLADKTITPGQDSTTITVQNTGNVDLTGVELTYTGDFDISFSENNFNLLAGTNNVLTVTITSDLDELDLGSNSVTITATADDTTSASGKITSEGDYCDYSNLGSNLDITIDNLDVTGESFGNDEEWYAFDTVEVEIVVENNGNDDIKKIEIEWGLFDKNTGKFIIDDKESDFNLNDGDDKTVTITFQLDKDIEDLQDGDLIFIAKATGEDKEFDSDDTCTSDSASISIVIPNDFVVLDNLKYSESVFCGTDVQITADTWNIGDDDQDDVSVRIFSKQLGIDKRIDVGNIDSFEKEKLDATINIPTNLEEGTYQLEFWVYDDSDDVFQSEDDDDSVFYSNIKLEGGCKGSSSSGTTSKALITASLETGGFAGQEMKIKAKITNTGTSMQTFKIEANGYEDWAELVTINPNSVLLDTGDSEEVILTLNVNDNALGEKSFNIKLTPNQGSAISQPVTVTIEKSGSFGSITGGIIGTGNWYLWGIGFLNLLLIIIIIIVAVRVVRK